MDSHRFFLKNALSSQNNEFPFFKRERLLELFFLSLFYASFSLSFSILHLFIEDELRDF
jgi:hypothetical protein